MIQVDFVKSPQSVPRNHLSAKDQFALNKFLLEGKDRLTDLRFSRAELAAHCAAELGFSVTESNIRGAEDVLECVIAKVSQHKVRIKSDTDRPRVLARAILHLYAQMGVLPPDDLRAIALGQTTNRKTAA